MIKKSEQIVFFGSGPVAAKSLQSLYEHFSIQTVFTKPAPSYHREEAPVARFAQEHSLNTCFITDRYELEDSIVNKNTQSDTRVGVLVDFGIIVPQTVINSFELGIVNSHFSLLPQLRGADPITFAILSGQRKTGVSLMLLVKAVDEGPLLAQETYDIRSDITTPELTEALVAVSNVMLNRSLPLYMSGQLSSVQQDVSIQATYSRKLTKDDGILDWNKDAEQLEREIRAFASWPKSHATINGIETVITKSHVVALTGTPGTNDVINRQLVVHCSEKSLVIDKLKPSGKKEMRGEDFLRGYLKV